MTIQLLIINNHDSFTYNLVELIRSQKINYQVINVEELDLNKVEIFSHILISPGPDVPKAYPQLFALLERYYQTKSILGVCLGHQALCQFFGGELYNLDKVRHGHKRKIFIKKKSLLFHKLPMSFCIGLYHSWAVAKDPFPEEELNILACCDEDIIMAVEHKNFPLYGIQFHPESYMSEYGYQIILNWLEIESKNQ